MSDILRLEAVNLRYSIGDTEDLSTRRGGGYMLLEAVRDVQAKFTKELMPISTGASIGLFSINADTDPTQVVTNIKTHLRDEYPHATFVVDIISKDDFKIGVEAVVTKNRWQQMQTLSFATVWGTSNEACETDCIRPAAARDKYKGKLTSLSVSARNRAGRQLRQNFYIRELALVDAPAEINLNDETFTDDTDALSKFNPTDRIYGAVPPNLNGKMAVFYADGNSFGNIQRSCANEGKLKSWDDDLKTKRRVLLHALLVWLKSTPLAMTSAGKLRFETLLWGGDEMLFLLPAWLGLEFAQKFFELTDDWSHGGQKLTHASGLVFAKHASPISQLQTLAHNLAEHGKQYDKTQNTLSWIVLESFDHAGDKMEKYWERNGVEAGIDTNGWKKLLLKHQHIKALRKLIPEVKENLPRSAMVRVLRSLASPLGAGAERSDQLLLERSYASTNQALVDSGEREKFVALWKLLGGVDWNESREEVIPADDAIAWTVLIELWDYLLPDALPPTQANNQIAAVGVAQ